MWGSRWTRSFFVLGPNGADEIALELHSSQIAKVARPPDGLKGLPPSLASLRLPASLTNSLHSIWTYVPSLSPCTCAIFAWRPAPVIGCTLRLAVGAVVIAVGGFLFPTNRCGLDVPLLLVVATCGTSDQLPPKSVTACFALSRAPMCSGTPLAQSPNWTVVMEVALSL